MIWQIGCQDMMLERKNLQSVEGGRRVAKGALDSQRLLSPATWSEQGELGRGAPSQCSGVSQPVRVRKTAKEGK